MTKKEEKPNGLLKNIMEGNFCPPAMHFVNNQNNNQRAEEKTREVDYLEEESVQVEPVVEEKRAQPISKKIFSVDP